MTVALMFTLVVTSLAAHVLPLPTLQFAIGRHGANIHYPDVADFFTDGSKFLSLR